MIVRLVETEMMLVAAFLYEITWFGFCDYENTKAIKEFENDTEESR